MGITHKKVVIGPQDPAFEVSKNEWNDTHEGSTFELQDNNVPLWNSITAQGYVEICKVVFIPTKANFKCLCMGRASIAFPPPQSEFQLQLDGNTIDIAVFDPDTGTVPKINATLFGLGTLDNTEHTLAILIYLEEEATIYCYGAHVSAIGG